jgi:hypothetical protein
MRTLATAAILALLIPIAGLALSAGPAQAQTTVTVDPAAINLGYMNVYNLPSDGGAFQFGSSWGFGDLTAVYSGNYLTLGPNTIGDPNEYWYQCVGDSIPPNCGGPGAPGNKIMEANAYAEVNDGSLAGQTVTFSGVVTGYSLTSAHTVVAFVKDYASDFSSFNQATVPLTATGPFTISLATVNDPTRHVQWGFQMVGVDVWITDVGPYGSITVGPDGSVPTKPTTWGHVKSLYN